MRQGNPLRGRYYSFHPGYLHPRKIKAEHFGLLVDISSIYSERILLALELYLVRGQSRQQACAAAGISQGQLSVKLRQLQDISATVIRLFQFYPEHTGVSESRGGADVLL